MYFPHSHSSDKGIKAFATMPLKNFFNLTSLEQASKITLKLLFVYQGDFRGDRVCSA